MAWVWRVWRVLRRLAEGFTWWVSGVVGVPVSFWDAVLFVVYGLMVLSLWVLLFIVG